MRKRMNAGLELDIKIVKDVLQYELMPTIYYKDLDASKTYYCMCGSPGSEEVNVVEYVYGRWLQYEFLPSVNMSHAWQVVEHFGEILVRRRLNGTDYRVWIELDNGSAIYEHAKTAPLAICLAALKAKGINIETL
jgi:hypothetical protein